MELLRHTEENSQKGNMKKVSVPLKKVSPKDEQTDNVLNLQECLRLPKTARIMKIRSENGNVKTFFFDYPEIAEMAKPGQFVMVGVFNGLKAEGEEIPLSLSYIHPESGLIGVTVKKAGKTTAALFEYKENDDVTVRGPYGNGFRDVNGRVGVVGGGVGIVALVPFVESLVRKGIDVTVFLGAKTKKELIFKDYLEKISSELIITTEDGSIGTKGLITAALEQSMKNNAYNHIIACGRELMMKETLRLAGEYGIPCQLSLERYIKCGRGVCGHCAIDGYLVCRDGPVFQGEIVRKMKDFGKSQLDESGTVVDLSF